MSTKAKQLQQTLDRLPSGKYTEQERKTLVFVDASGATVRLNAPDAVEKLKERIAMEQGKADKL